MYNGKTSPIMIISSKTNQKMFEEPQNRLTSAQRVDAIRKAKHLLEFERKK